MLASVLTGGAFCMFAVTALWLAGAGDEPRDSSVRQSSLQASALGDDLGSAAVEPPREPDAAPRGAPAPEPTNTPLDRELAAGDEAEELDRDLLIPAQPRQQDSTEAPAQPRAVADAGAETPEIAPPPEPEAEVAEEDTDEGARAAEPEPLTFEPCGMEVCGPGLVCCNASCGTCVAPGGTCSQLTCSMNVYPLSSFCGRNTCSVGEVCCNLSCGICAAPGEPCSQRLCD
jgi:hypothetical protein